MLTNPCYINRDYIVFSFKTVVKIFIFFFQNESKLFFFNIYDLILQMDGAFNGYYKMPLHSVSFVFRRQSKYLYVFICVAKQAGHVFKSD